MNITKPALTAALLLATLATWAPRADARETCRNADVVFLIDISYSFGDIKSTRDAFAEGIGNFLDGIGPDHRIGLVTFGDGAKEKVGLASHKEATRNEIVRQISLFRFKDPWTDVAGGLEMAWKIASKHEKRRGVVIMISDGAISMPDPAKGYGKTESEKGRQDQLARIRAMYQPMKDSDTQFYTLAYVGKNTDYELMKEIAESTDGMYTQGTTDELAAVMGNFAAEWCKRDPNPKPEPKHTGTAHQPMATSSGGAGGTATPPPTPTPPPAATAPIAPPVPPTPPLPLWVGLLGVGVASSTTGFVVHKVTRKRKARQVAAFVAQRDAQRERQAAELEAQAEAERRARRERERRQDVERKLAAAKAAEEAEAEAERKRRVQARSRPQRPDRPVSRPGEATFIGPAPTAPSSGSSSAGAPPSKPPPKKGPPPKPTAPPRRGGGENLVWIVAYRGSGDVIRQVEFRGNGDQVIVIGPMAEALLEVPDDRVMGAVRLTVDRDGERVVRVSEVPPGGFTDIRTGESLGTGARLKNNQRFAWVRESRNRYCEVIYK